VNTILEHINSTILTDLTLNEITQKAAVINHKFKTRRIEEAQILTKLLLYMYELMQTIDLTLNAVKDRQTTVIKWLEHLWNKRIPQFNLSNITETLKLGSFDREHFLEATNCILNLFQFLLLQTVVFWFNEFFKPTVTSLYVSEVIQNVFKSEWMCLRSQKQPSISIEVAVLSAVFFILIWEKNQITCYINDLREHIINHVNLNLLSMSDTCKSESDSHHYLNDSQWRNEIQRQLRFPALLVDFVNIMFKYLNMKETLLSETDISLWTDLITQLISLSDSSEVSFTYILRPLNDEKYSFKYFDLSLAIADTVYVNLTDNVAWIKEKDLFNDSKIYISMKADEKGLIDQKESSDVYQLTLSILLRTECAEVICQVQLQRKAEQQIILSFEGFRKSVFNSSSNVYI